MDQRLGLTLVPLGTCHSQGEIAAGSGAWNHFLAREALEGGLFQREQEAGNVASLLNTGFDHQPFPWCLLVDSRRSNISNLVRCETIAQKIQIIFSKFAKQLESYSNLYCGSVFICLCQ